MPTSTGALLLVAAAFFAAGENAPASDAHPLSETERQRMNERLEQSVESLTRRIAENGNDTNLHSQRGDAYFFLGRFDEALADYDRMIEIDDRYARSHWRRGIAAHCAGRYADAFRQFDDYHEEDAVDREGGIWRYFAQYKKDGPEKARAGLQRYDHGDREPFNALYEFFQGTLTADEVVAKVEKNSPDARDRRQRMFYVHLYIGLDHALADRKDEARRHLREAVANDWGRTASYGPHFMWQVGRVEYDRLSAPSPKEKKE